MQIKIDLCFYPFQKKQVKISLSLQATVAKSKKKNETFPAYIAGKQKTRRRLNSSLIQPTFLSASRYLIFPFTPFYFVTFRFTHIHTVRPRQEVTDTLKHQSATATSKLSKIGCFSQFTRTVLPPRQDKSKLQLEEFLTANVIVPITGFCL